MIPHKQLSMAEIFSDCQEKFENDKYQFLSFLENTINLDKFISISFRNHFYASTGRPREYPLIAMLWALLLQRIFSIPTDKLLIIFLKYSKELREFCGFNKVPDASKFTRFKQDFILDLQSMFDNLIDVTEPICQQIDEAKASMTIFDTSGIEAYVTENNPKFANRIISQLKSYKKAMKFNDSYDLYKAAYGSMLSHASSNQEIKQLYINGHFCYVYKFGIVTNGLGIVRDISFLNKDFLKAHPVIAIDKKTDSPDEDKSLHDAKAVIPVLKDFFKKHPLINPDIFIGDAAFDSCIIYKSLLQDIEFSKTYIPLNSRSKLKNEECPVNEDGIPCCPHDHSLLMKPEETYKIRSVVEQSINHFKDSFCIAGRKTRNENTIHADLLLVGITQLITVVLADKIHKHEYIRSLKPLIT